MTRPGVSLAEMLVVATLFAAVLASLAGFAAAQSRLAARAQDRSRAEDVARTARLVLGGELRSMDSADISALTPDSVRIRAVRGGGPVCDADAGALVVRYRGVRRPDPRKDSVMVIRVSGTGGRVQALRHVARDGRCGGSLQLDVDDPGPATGWVLVFETGAYHLADRAFRYRRGRGGRQPLTEALLGDGRFQAVPGGIQIRLELARDSLPRLDSLTMESTIRLLNPGAP